MENQYEPLTKQIIDSDGRQKVVCAFSGTEKCPIHKNNEAIDDCMCKAMALLLRQQLGVFEGIYLEND